MLKSNPNDPPELIRAIQRRNKAEEAVSKAKTADEMETAITHMDAARKHHGALLLRRDKMLRPEAHLK